MKILHVNKFFYVKGGSERYYFDLCRLLSAKGHEVLHFSMRHPRNQPSSQAQYFVSQVDFNSPMGPASRISAAMRILYSIEAKKKIGNLVDRLKPDIVHFHNINRQLSPSIIDALSSRSIPMVQTLHDLSLVCPAHSFFVNGKPCEECGAGAYWHGIPKKCIDGKFTSTLLGVAEAYFHKWLGIYRKIAKFIAPSKFLGSKIARLGWTESRIVHLPYFVPQAPDYSGFNNGYVLFAGRVSEEKGVGVLLEAAKSLKKRSFIVAGEGEALKEYCRKAVENNITNIEFIGYVKGDDLENLIKGAACVVVPSVSYENLPLTILEAFARGKPVVGSRAGGIPELVKDGETGYTFEPGSGEALAEAIESTVSDETRRTNMGIGAREFIGGEFSAEYHYGRITSIYEEIL